VRLVKAAAQGLTASIRRWSSPWEDASIATRVDAVGADIGQERLQRQGSGVVWMPGAE
jgi:hypothetical protein